MSLFISAPEWPMTIEVLEATSDDYAEVQRVVDLWMQPNSNVWFTLPGAVGNVRLNPRSATFVYVTDQERDAAAGDEPRKKVTFPVVLSALHGI